MPGEKGWGGSWRRVHSMKKAKRMLRGRLHGFQQRKIRA